MVYTYVTRQADLEVPRKQEVNRIINEASSLIDNLMIDIAYDFVVGFKVLF